MSKQQKDPSNSIDTPTSEPPSFQTEWQESLPAPIPARLPTRDTTTSKATSEYSDLSIYNMSPSIIAPSIQSTSTSGGRASLVSGQVDIQVKENKRRPREQKANSSITSFKCRDILPELKGEIKEKNYQSLRNAFDWRFALTIINPIEYFWPLTIRRVTFWILYGGIAVGLYYLNHFYHWANVMTWAFRYQSWIAMGLIYGLEPLIMLLLYLIARLPEANKYLLPSTCHRCLTNMEDGLATPSNTETTALVIPCHKTELLSFFNVLKGAFKHFKPDQIFIVENGNSPTPPSTELEDFCRRIHPDIQYIWSPIASKNAAQYIGTLAARQYDCIMTTDDDVVLPWNFRCPTDKITEEIKAVCFPISAKASSQDSWAGADSLVVSWQDIEFKASGLIKTAEDQLCSVLYPHGACSFWERPTFLKVLQMHSLVFYGEDSQMGFAMQKILQTYALYSIACNLIRVPLFIIMYNRPGFWTKFALFSLAPILPPLVYKFIKARHRPDLESALIPVLTFPIYKAVFQIVSCLGALRCIFYYWPSIKHTKTIKEWEKEDVFWLTDQFYINPGYLARRDGNDEKKDELLEEEKGDHLGDLGDDRSRPGRALSVISRSQHITPSLLYGDPAYQPADMHKQQRMEQQMIRLESSVGRMESMLFELSRKL